MTPAAFKSARKALHHTQETLARAWGMGKNGARTIRRWEDGHKPIPEEKAEALLDMLEGK